MKKITMQQTVGEIVAESPKLARVFEALGLDYCCGGKKTLAQACIQRNLDPQATLLKLQEERTGVGTESGPAAYASTMSLTELVDHIEQAHHAYLHEELPRLAALLLKVATTHGEKDPRLKQVQETFRGMSLELWKHIYKEEEQLFPMIRQLEASDGLASDPGGIVADQIRQLETEHDDAGAALEGLRKLTDGYVPPEWACKTYRALLAGLAYLERDMHTHVHKENHVLFPRALQLESQTWQKPPVANAQLLNWMEKGGW